jgi:hypothetical protein
LALIKQRGGSYSLFPCPPSTGLKEILVLLQPASLRDQP